MTEYQLTLYKYLLLYYLTEHKTKDEKSLRYSVIYVWKSLTFLR